MRGRRLSRDFFARHVLDVARELIGRRLVFERRGREVAGRIVEVEAYRGPHDPASHAFRGPTERSAIMFGPPGHTYVYLSYGMHHCLNVVTEPEGEAAAVLIRALEPTDGIASMRRRRGNMAVERLARGPGCVTRALGLDLRHNGLDLASGPLWIDARPACAPGRTLSGPRIGIRAAVDRPWRFVLEGSPAVSGPRRRTGGMPPEGRALASRAARDLR